MKISYILTQDIESPSGIRYYSLAREIAKLGHTVSIIALHPDYKNLSAKIFTTENVHIYYVAQMHVRKVNNIKNYHSLFQLAIIVVKATWNLTRYTLQEKPDIIHIGKPHPMNSIAAFISKFINKTPLVLDCDDYEAASGNFRNAFEKKTIEYFEKTMPKKVSLVTTNTFFMQDKLSSWGIPPKKIVYLPNGVDPERFPSPSQEEIMNLRKSLNLEGKKVISFIGSLGVTTHAIDLLINAFQKITLEHPNTILLIIGSGEDYHHLAKMVEDINIKDKVIFTGRIPPDEIYLYYHISDITVDPVKNNEVAKGRCPLKLFESWQCGTLFISSDVGDRGMLIGNPPAGILTNPDDINSLYKGITNILNNTRFTKSIIQEGKTRITNYYWSNLARQMEKYYISLLPSP